MSVTETISSIDFSAPRRLTGTANRALTAWLTTACSVLQENWQGLLGTGVELRTGRVDSSLSSKAIRAFPDPGYAARLSMGPDGFPGIAVFSGRLVHALVADMLGGLGADWPEVRPLTPAEASMVELLFGEVARSLSNAWPDVEPLECHLDSVVSRPLRSRVFPPDEVLVRTIIAVTTPLGPEEIILLFPQDRLSAIGITDTVVSESSTPRPAPQLRVIAERLPVTLSVELGTATLSLAALNGLTAGDVLLLDQTVSSPLQATIEGRLYWLGYPCRLGQRQGFRILSAVDS